MFLTKLYKYDSTQEANGYRGEDFTPYVLQSATFNEDITQELDTQEITLNGLPFSEEFAPETKFIADIVEQLTDQEIIHQTIHLCVSSDMVNKPILSDDNYYNHHIFFIEPSVVAQKRLVDNISATYKLKDVSLEQLPAYDTSITPILNNQSSSFTPNGNFGITRISYFLGDNQEIRRFGKYLVYEGTIRVYNPNDLNTPINKKYLDINDLNVSSDPNNPDYQAVFKVPKVAIYAGLKDSTQFAKLGYASIDVTIEERDLGNNITNSWSREFISKDNLDTNTNVYRPYYLEYSSGVPRPSQIFKEWICEDVGIPTDVMYGRRLPNFYYRKYTDISQTTDPTYQMPVIPIKEGSKYIIKISLHQFNDQIEDFFDYSTQGQTLTGNTTKTYQEGQPTKFIDWDLHSSWWTANLIRYELTNAQTNADTEFITYGLDPLSVYYATSTPYSALALLQKAIVNSCICEKIDGVYCADVNNSHLPFYIDPNYVTKLSGTVIIENFYNQKNLWEIAIEVGHYIHAIPELKFGSDDRFMFTFNELGRTDQKEDSATKISIFNSRSVEDYICATSSYVSNMVQLGGYIQEWVAPKTNNETMLVSNDTANIKVTKPIIELLGITIKCINPQNYSWATINEERDFTPYVYEKNVYDTLSVRFVDVPNRGIAMYYQLGSNSIDGGDFRSPTVNTGDKQNDYTFKKIIYCAYNGYPTSNLQDFNGWATVKVNDFVFLVRYRTKDTARMNHLRPDLRKYLLNSQYDRYPQHNQFNNQQDVLVDSVKFGNNLYGKLIKTGNSEYTINEWESDFANVKHKGELYRINGDLYYVAKATHEIQSNCIISKIKYSKDYNELSAVIGIPSEPRFYEISEQSQIRREVAINDLLYVTDNVADISYNNSYLLSLYHLRDLVFAENTGFAQFALTVFKGDKDTAIYDQTVGEPYFYKETFVPINAYSSENTLTYEWDMLDNYSAGDKVITPPSTPQETYDTNYNSLRAVQYTDVFGKSALMDFFILGENQLLEPLALTNNQVKAQPESPYKTRVDDDTDTRNSVYDMGNNVFATNVITAPYTQVNYSQFVSVDDYVGYYVRSSANSYNMTLVTESNKNTLGIVVGSTEAYEKTPNYDYNGKGICLLKDCREAISCNYNLQLATSSDTFVLSPFIFLPQKRNIKLVLLTEEVNKLSDGYLDVATFLTPKDINDNPMNTLFTAQIGSVYRTNTSWGALNTTEFYVNLATTLAQVNPKHFTGEDGYARIKAIAVICNVNINPSGNIADLPPTIPNKTQFIIARNIPETFTQSKTLANWYFGAPKKDIFTNKQ